MGRPIAPIPLVLESSRSPRRRPRAGRVGVVAASCLIAAAGCTEYRTADGDAGIKPLLGHRCVVAEAASFPAGGGHWFPTPASPRPYGLERVDAGTVLRVSHVGHWWNPFGPVGDIVFADAENGPSRGTRFVIGDLFDDIDLPEPRSRVISCVEPPPPGVSPEAGRSLRPLDADDVGLFYSGDWATQGGLAVNRRPLPRWTGDRPTTPDGNK